MLRPRSSWQRPTRAPTRLQVAVRELLLALGVDVEYEARMEASRSRHFVALAVLVAAILCAMADPSGVDVKMRRWGERIMRAQFATADAADGSNSPLHTA